MERIKPLLSEIADSDARKMVDEFWAAAGRYFGILHGIDADLENGRSDEESACALLSSETNIVLGEGKKLEESLADPILIDKVKKLFRDCAIPLGVKSSIVKHAFTKPRGYAGDYGIIEIIYNDRPLSQGFGYCIDRRFQADDYARAVRSRMKKMKEILAQFLNDARPESRDVLNIACGSCREIRELIDEGAITRTGKISFTLVDQDGEALEFTRKALAGSPPNIEYRFLRNSIYDYVKDPARAGETLRGKDLVYTIGLADYIPDEPLKILISFLYGLLRPGGRLVIAHKDSKNFSPLAADWWCDWTFHLRDQSDVVSLVEQSGLAGYRMDVVRESDTSIIFFMLIEKQR